MAPHAEVTDFFTSASADEYSAAALGPLDDADVPRRSPATGINILIVGAGTAGLTAAMECWRKGHNVISILERNKDPVFTGDNLAVQPSALGIFKHWPAMHRHVDNEGYDAQVTYRRHTGEHVFGPVPPMFNEPEAIAKRKGLPKASISQSRVKLYKRQLEQVVRLGIHIEWGVKVSDFFEDEAQAKAGVTCADGTVHLADLVIAADGLKTSSNHVVCGQHDKPEPSGWAAYRTAYPVEYALRDPVIAEYWPLKEGDKPKWEFWLGPGMHAMMMIAHDMVTWGINHRDDGSGAESWTPNVKPDEVLATLDSISSDWHPAMKALIRSAPPHSIVHWRLMWRELRETWTSPSGRVVQIGDAAHAFMPTSGNGATQGMEDATALASCLELAGSAARAGTAAKIFNALRYQRVSCMQKAMFVNSQTKGATDWDAVKKDPSVVRTRFNRWQYEHDPEQYVYEKYGEAYNDIVNGGPKLVNTNYPPGHTFRSWTIDQVKQDIAAGKKIADMLDGDWS